MYYVSICQLTTLFLPFFPFLNPLQRGERDPRGSKPLSADMLVYFDFNHLNPTLRENCSAGVLWSNGNSVQN